MLAIAPIRFDDRGDFDRWREYLHSRADSHASDLAEWRLLFQELYGFQSHAYICLDAGRAVGALSLYHVRSSLMGKMLVTSPFFGYGGFYWETDEARDTLLAQAEQVAKRLDVDYIEIRSRRELPEPFRANTDFAEFDLEFGETSAATWTERLTPNVRQNIRKALGQPLEFHLETDFDPCYNLLRRTLRAHGTPFHGRQFFELMGERLSNRVRYSEVRHAGASVAGGVVIRFKDTILTPYIGSLATSRASRSNYFQYWKIIEAYATQGVTRFEMGRSPRGSTHAQFKKKWGCTEVPVFYNFRIINSRRGYRSVSQPSAIQLLATRVWRQLPLAVTTVLGPRLFRHIP